MIGRDRPRSIQPLFYDELKVVSVNTIEMFCADATAGLATLNAFTRLHARSPVERVAILNAPFS